MSFPTLPCLARPCRASPSQTSPSLASPGTFNPANTRTGRQACTSTRDRDCLWFRGLFSFACRSKACGPPRSSSPRGGLDRSVSRCLWTELRPVSEGSPSRRPRYHNCMSRQRRNFAIAKRIKLTGFRNRDIFLSRLRYRRCKGWPLALRSFGHPASQPTVKEGTTL
jgi:hypothetical protein